MTWFKDYELVTSLEEAARYLAEPGSVIIGGGSRLVALKPDDAEHLIDLMPLGLDRLSENDTELRLEARLRLEDLAQRQDFGGLLKQAVLSMAHSVNLRNQMTVAGETAWSRHLNEWQVALLVLDALVERHDEPPIAIADYLSSPQRTGIITALSLPKRKGWRTGFERVAPAEGARPLLVLAGAARVEAGRFADLRLAAGNLGPLPQRLGALERRLAGSELYSWGVASAKNKRTGVPRAGGAGAKGSSPRVFTLQDSDGDALTLTDSPNANRDAKWRWTEICIQRFLGSLAAGTS